MRPLVSRRVTLHWDTPPHEVAAAIQSAIDEERYEDAGLGSSYWLVRGAVRGLALDLRMTTHSAPRALNAYATGLDVRGDLVAAPPLPSQKASGTP